MNYARVREKLKEKNKALKGLTGSEREKAEKSIIESGYQDESQVENDSQSSSAGDSSDSDESGNDDHQSESENPQEEKQKVSQSYQGKKRGPKPRR